LMAKIIATVSRDADAGNAPSVARRFEPAYS
jgi:hypothetical protein